MILVCAIPSVCPITTHVHSSLMCVLALLGYSTPNGIQSPYTDTLHIWIWMVPPMLVVLLVLVPPMVTTTPSCLVSSTLIVYCLWLLAYSILVVYCLWV